MGRWPARGPARRPPAKSCAKNRAPRRSARHDWRRVEVDLAGYSASGLPTETMGRSLSQDPLFFAAALAGGALLAGLVGPGGPARRGVGDRATRGPEEGPLLA